jgi:hypothetical protein
MGWLDKLRAAIGQTKDPKAELERAAKQAEVEAMKSDDVMKVKLPPGSGPR